MTGVTLHSDQFIRVPEDRYKVGVSTEDADRIARELPRTLKPEYIYHSVPSHHVVIDEFFMCNRPVTLSQFNAFILDTGFETEAEMEGWGWTWENGWKKREGLTWQDPFGNEADELYRQSPEHVPALQVSCNDAMAFCQWLTEKTGTHYRLPEETQWEVFAAMAGVPGMEELSLFNLPGIPRTTVDFMEMLHEYIYHKGAIMPGLAWEWTRSWFDAYPGGEQHDEYGTTYRVLRGGSLMSNGVQKGRQYRFRRCPTARSPFYCFRVLF